MRHNNKIMHWSDFFSHNEGTNNFLHISGQKIPQQAITSLEIELPT